MNPLPTTRGGWKWTHPHPSKQGWVTKTQALVIEELIKGLAQKEIATKLKFSLDNVKQLLDQARKRTGTRTSCQLVAEYLKRRMETPMQETVLKCDLCGKRQPDVIPNYWIRVHITPDGVFYANLPEMEIARLVEKGYKFKAKDLCSNECFLKLMTKVALAQNPAEIKRALAL